MTPLDVPSAGQLYVSNTFDPLLKSAYNNQLVSYGASTANLFVSPRFSIVRMDLNSADSTYGYQCGAPQQYATVGLPGSGVVDLSTFYFNNTGRNWDPITDCITLDNIMATYLVGRQYIRVGCDVINVIPRFSALYYKIQFFNIADRDYLYATISNTFFWQSVVFPQLNPGCGFFATYQQTTGTTTFYDPNYFAPPSTLPFQQAVDYSNPYYTVCTDFLPEDPNIAASSLAPYPPTVVSWAPPQTYSLASGYTLGSTGGLTGTQNLGINTKYGYGNFTPYVTLCNQLNIQAPIYDSVSLANVQGYLCPYLQATLVQKFISMGVDLGEAYPPEFNNQNGCASIRSIVSLIDYQVFFRLTKDSWDYLKSSSGLANAEFVDASGVICESSITFSTSAGSPQLVLTSKILPALSNQQAPLICSLDILEAN
eukprot:gene24952-biopygen19376